MVKEESTELAVVKFQSKEELIQTIRPADVAIKDLVAKYGKLKTNGVDDTEAYNAVVAAHKEVKKYKSAIEKTRKELKQPVLEYGKLIDSTAKSLTEDIEFLVDHLGTERKKVEDEKERLKREAEEAEARRIQGRKDALYEAGCVFDGERYAYQEEGITELELVSLEDDEFDKFVKKVTKIRDKVEKDKAEEAEAQRKKDEEFKALQEKLARYEAEEAAKKEEEERLNEANAAAQEAREDQDEVPLDNPGTMTELTEKEKEEVKAMIQDLEVVFKKYDGVSSVAEATMKIEAIISDLHQSIR